MTDTMTCYDLSLNSFFTNLRNYAALLIFQIVIDILDHSGYAWLVCVILLGVTEFLFAHLSKPFNLYTM